MNTKPFLLRFYGEKIDGQWSVLCLDISLAAQADTLPEARRLLNAQIESYFRDIFGGAGALDAEHAERLLKRRAPLKYWVKFYVLRFLARLHADPSAAHHHLAKEPIPLQHCA
jgi:hypothetical protein